MATNWKNVGDGLGGAAIILGSLVTPFLRNRRMTWGTTGVEAGMKLPGDELIPNPKWQYTNTITINAPASEVWPWLVQLGQGRGGWYSYEWLENLVGCDIHNADTILPDCQQLEVGDSVLLAKGMPGYPVAIVEDQRTIVLNTDSRTGDAPFPGGKKNKDDYYASTWAFLLEETPDKKTRFISRLRSDYSPGFMLGLMFGKATLEPISTAMQRKMMREIKARAES